MGEYVFKTTKHEVELDNGEHASVAVFAYKPSSWDSDKQHMLSGAAACDRAAANGQRHDWTILGHLSDGVITVDVDALAKKTGQQGSFSDGWFDALNRDTGYPIWSNSSKVVLSRTREEMKDEVSGEYIVEHFIETKPCDGVWKEVGRQAFKRSKL